MHLNRIYYTQSTGFNSQKHSRFDQTNWRMYISICLKITEKHAIAGARRSLCKNEDARNVSVEKGLLNGSNIYENLEHLPLLSVSEAKLWLLVVSFAILLLFICTTRWLTYILRAPAPHMNNSHSFAHGRHARSYAHAMTLLSCRVTAVVVTACVYCVWFRYIYITKYSITRGEC